MNDLSSWSVVVAGIVSVITTVVVRKVLQGEYSPLGHPVILGCVGLLAFIGLCKFCREQTGWLLVPYAALAISILLVLMFLPFLNKHGEGEKGGRHSPRNGENGFDCHQDHVESRDEHEDE